MSIMNLHAENRYFFRIRGENISREISKYDLKSLFYFDQNELLHARCSNAFIRNREELIGRGYHVPDMDWIIEEMMQVMSGGTVMAYPFKNIYGDCSRGITFISKRHFFRGENSRFPKSVPSLTRKLSGYTGKERELRRCIAYMRCWQFFKSFLWNFHITKYWEAKLGDVNYLALAQHYGFPTELLDVTTDFRIALFFSTCKYIPETDSYRPLTKEDIEKDEASQWGCIFHAPAWTCDYLNGGGEAIRVQNEFMSRMYQPISLTTGDLDNVAFQIGYQPFYRCHYQSGYIMPMVEGNPLQASAGWEKLYFRQTPELSQAVFKRMKQGRSVYPHEGIIKAQNVIEEIRSSTTFSKDDVAFIYNIEELGRTYFKDVNELIKALNGYDYGGNIIKISETDVSFSVPQNVKDEINQQYDNKDILDRIGGKLRVKFGDQKYRDACCERIYGRLI